ncbi:MAG: aminotransferase class I/II-fold pyridoxal phosphate-dependent enzyme [Clostridiales bacterium]|nr:aminotransferase class I/II-fold pyridoxal phosphate-dependent enzyme [Clostridiales bacterium]
MHERESLIPVNEPLIGRNALAYVTQCIETGWVSSSGSFIPRFEQEFARYLGVKHAITTTSGTTALHLAMASLGLGPGDEVIIPALTMIAVPYAVLYTGGEPVFVDVDPEIFAIDPEKVREFIDKNCSFDSKKRKLLNKRTGRTVSAIVPVHLYGHPCAMDEIMAVARSYNLAVIEDAAEAHGALYFPAGNKAAGRLAGTIGLAGCFSFYANKIVTTGEGGMVVTDDDALAERARRLKDLAHDPERRFLHTELGFNYRMTNLQAAIGVAQLEEIDRFIAIKREMAQTYQELLSGVPGLVCPQEKEWARSVYWMYTVLVEKEFGLSRDELMRQLRERGVDTRTFFVPCHKQPLFQAKAEYRKLSFPVSEALSEKGLYLPSGLALTKGQMKRVVAEIKKIASKRL